MECCKKCDKCYLKETIVEAKKNIAGFMKNGGAENSFGVKLCREAIIESQNELKKRGGMEIEYNWKWGNIEQSEKNQ